MKVMRTELAAAVLLGGSVIAADAADIGPGPENYEEPASFAVPLTWAGFYAGVNLGGKFDDQIEGSNIIGDVDDSFTGGIHTGYNWMAASKWVYGFEVDMNLYDDEVDAIGGSTDLTSYSWTVRGRLGYAMGNTLIYGTGGLALVGFDEEFPLEDVIDNPAVGYVAGGGVAHRFWGNWSLGVEGLYYDVSSEIDGTDLELERDFWTVQARLSYHFNRPMGQLFK